QREHEAPRANGGVTLLEHDLLGEIEEQRASLRLRLPTRRIRGRVPPPRIRSQPSMLPLVTDTSPYLGRRCVDRHFDLGVVLGVAREVRWPTRCTCTIALVQLQRKDRYARSARSPV